MSDLRRSVLAYLASLKRRQWDNTKAVRRSAMTKDPAWLKHWRRQ